MIELLAVSKSFGEVRAVDGVDLRVTRGEFLTLLGPSGCGKTTILRMIAGFETPDSGIVRLDGSDVTNTPPYRRDVNQVFQSYALFPHMTVRQNIAFGLRMKRLRRREIHERVGKALALVSLSGTESRRPNELSGGQRQRVALARAIVREPKVLLLDEPLAALDARLRQAMQVELKQLQRQLGITFLFVTHDQSEALAMSDRVAVMNQGRIEQLGAPAEVYRRPANAFVARFIGQANLWEAEVVERSERFARLRVSPDVSLSVPAQTVPSGSSKVQVLVRPERVRISAQRRGDEDFEAEVIDELFAGATTQLRLRTRGGLEMSAMVMQQTEVDRSRPVFCQISADDITILGAS